jgi:hypothetical protein
MTNAKLSRSLVPRSGLARSLPQQGKDRVKERIGLELDVRF